MDVWPRSAKGKPGFDRPSKELSLTRRCRARQARGQPVTVERVAGARQDGRRKAEVVDDQPKLWELRRDAANNAYVVGWVDADGEVVVVRRFEQSLQAAVRQQLEILRAEQMGADADSTRLSGERGDLLLQVRRGRVGIPTTAKRSGWRAAASST